MSQSQRKIKTHTYKNGTVKTFTTGQYVGKEVPLNVEIRSQPMSHRKPTELLLEYTEDSGDYFNLWSLRLNGRQARTLQNALNKHFENQ